MGVNVAFWPIEPPTKLYRLGQSARRKVEVNCASAAMA